jgi:hypothetical protein
MDGMPHRLFARQLPKSIVVNADMLLADREEVTEEIDYPFDIASASAGGKQVCERVKTKAATDAENFDIAFASTFSGVGEIVVSILGFHSGD